MVTKLVWTRSGKLIRPSILKRHTLILCEVVSVLIPFYGGKRSTTQHTIDFTLHNACKSTFVTGLACPAHDAEK